MRCVQTVTSDRGQDIKDRVIYSMGIVAWYDASFPMSACEIIVMHLLRRQPRSDLQVFCTAVACVQSRTFG